MQQQDDGINEEPSIQTLEDGTVRIEWQGQIGFVSSFHLVEPKLRQLKAAKAASAET